jgi:hypothetical protein
MEGDPKLTREEASVVRMRRPLCCWSKLLMR